MRLDNDFINVMRNTELIVAAAVNFERKRASRGYDVCGRWRADLSSRRVSLESLCMRNQTSCSIVFPLK